MSGKKPQYIKMDPIFHVLARPDMYVGSTRPRNMEEFVVGDEDLHIVKRTVEYSPAILRIFIEPLSNVIDNVARSKKGRNKVTKICVDINDKTGETKFWNDGEVIPVEMHSEEKCYNHTLIFGHLLTSSNYDDEEDRYDISGRNGLGVKLCNVFSSKFTVSGYDPKKKKLFTQTWTNNMKTTDTPTVKSAKFDSGFTSISYIPDFKQFGLDEYSDDILSVYKKYIIDMAMLTKVPVYFNESLIPIKDLFDYANLYSDGELSSEILHIKTPSCEVVLTPATEYQAISFANGVSTPLGGTHVDAWSEKLFRPLVDKFTVKGKPQLNIKDVKNCFRLFVVASVVNPEFESQNKMKLERPTVEAKVKKSHISTLMKWSVISRLEDLIRAKEFTQLKKLERKKRGYTKVDNHERANNEGGKNGHKCTLILVEGDSAKTYASGGLEIGAFGKTGHDWFGIYKLRGKVLNCRNASVKQITVNNVVGDIIKVLGLRHDADYKDEKVYKTLRYGRIMLITDADVDGIHISGLVLNMLHALFPSLLEREEPFVVSMYTPIVRITLGKNDILFYDEREYKKYVINYSKKFPGKKLTQKYYKGLGTSNDEMIIDTFGKKLLFYTNDPYCTENMNKVFHKNCSDMRKDWLANYDSNNIKLTWDGEKYEEKRIKLSDFINTEMIKFSLEDCKRSIPHVLDGFKESQRKILYVALLKNLDKCKSTIKVAQFGAQVAFHSAYHHGEHNLFDTLVKMAQSFPGSNNIPLFVRDGGFGSRLLGGKDAASPRYIYTKLEKITRALFHPEDDELLNHLEDDGNVVEPEYYMPILPMILINGCSAGIGTGWSSNVPSYNPADIITSIKVWIKNEGKVLVKDDDMVCSMLPDLVPWYRGWTGTIEKSGDGRYITKGRIVEKTATKKIVEELPIGYWTDKFIDKMDKLLEDKQIANYKNYSNPKTVNVEITESEDGLLCNYSNLKLTSYIYTSNMVMFTPEGLRKFNSVDEIIDYFCEKRYRYYVKRKINMINNMNEKISVLGNKKRFMEEVISGDIKLFKTGGSKRVARPTTELTSELEERGYDKFYKKKKQKLDGDVNEEETEDDNKDHGYDYLLTMQFRSITAEKINKLNNDIASNVKKLNELQETSESSMWLSDLDNFEKCYNDYLKAIEKEKIKLAKKKKNRQ